jgi:transcriptional regulator NrdR family protein
MKCPQCGADSHVLSTRHLTERRRECFNAHKFSTTEVPVVEVKRLTAIAFKFDALRRLIQDAHK